MHFMSLHSMGSFLFRNLAWVFMLLFVCLHGCKGCVKEERASLLEFKAFLRSNGENANALLRSWVDDNISDCCRWERVACDPTTRRVNKLFLSDVRQSQYGLELSSDILSYENDKLWLLNASMFLPFEELRHLNLSANSFDGFVKNEEGFKVFSGLKKLEMLDICSNEFDKSVLRSLAMIISLKTLGLCSMGLNGSFPIQELSDLKNLEVLDLRNNYLESFPPMQEWTSLRNLKVLDLSENRLESFQIVQDSKRPFIFESLENLNLYHNNFKNTSIQQLNMFMSLKMLFLGGNNLEGLFPIQDLHCLENLLVLDLSANRLTGFQDSKSPFIFGSLETLNLGGNDFKNIRIQQLNIFTSLKMLSLDVNNLEGLFPIQDLYCLENLVVLDLSFNSLIGFEDSKSPFIFGSLETLNLDGNNFKMINIQQLNIFTSLKMLSIKSNNLEGFFPIQDLHSLKNLTMLDLSSNGLIGFEGFKSSYKLKKLEILDLADNNFKENIIRKLSTFTTSLKTLVLSFNNMRGPFPYNELSIFQNLTTLDLRYNSLNGSLPIQAFTGLTNLEVLDLSYNSFSGIIPSSIRLMSSLKSLSLASNNFSGYSLPNQDLCQLNKLQQLVLRSNFLQGTLPPCLNNLTSLRLLDLSYNSFWGNLTCSLLASLTSLEYIHLSNNLFEGSFSFNCLANHSKLQVIKLGSWSNKFSVETEDSTGWVPLFQLKVLSLSNCKLMDSLPNFLRYQFQLAAVDLSHNKLTGRFPNWLIENNTGLEFLALRNNSLMGEILLQTPNHCIRPLLDISDNQFIGKLQNLANMIPNVLILNLSNNGFEGILPSSIADLKYLRILDLSTNNFYGEVPRKLLRVDHLERLILSNNKFEGEIFSTDLKLTSLEQLYLDNNHFTGNLSKIIVEGSKLFALDLSHNNMSGEIPSGIGNMTYLETLLLANNSFKGKLPHEISKLQELEFLDVSHNTLSGHLPCLNGMDKLKHLHLQVNMFEGSIPNDFLNSSSLLTLDLRDNKLTGSIPSSISTLSELRILVLGGNCLSGIIPNQLCHLRNISLMDLSNNNFSGSIPKCFSFIPIGNMRIENVFEPKFHSTSWEGYSFEFGNIDETINFSFFDEQVEDDKIQFVTKYRFDSYGGGILDIISGLDLSCNNLSGEIPHELGMLKGIQTLNLSHNQLKGSIPKSLSNLSQIESLDLSYNQLSGQIPPELVELNFLSVFNVAHNNISGLVPDKAQFGTFNEESYEGNPFLCGQLVHRKCDKPPPKPSRESGENWYDMDTFFATFASSYVTILLAFVIVLYINPYWRRRWFAFIEECLYSCYYFACDTYSKLVAYLY